MICVSIPGYDLSRPIVWVEVYFRTRLSDSASGDVEASCPESRLPVGLCAPAGHLRECLENDGLMHRLCQYLRRLDA